MITRDMLDNWFRFHTATHDQPEKYEAIMAAARAFADVVVANTPPSADQTTAVRGIREVTWVACASIACGGA